MTLIEIVAALVLAATVLASALTAYGRAMRQRSIAMKRMQGSEIAEQLLSEWLLENENGALPTDENDSDTATGEHTSEDGSRWIWRLTEVRDSYRDRANGRVPYRVSKYEFELFIESVEDRSKNSVLKMEFAGNIVARSVDDRGGAP